MFEIYDVNTLELVTTIETAGTNVSTRLIDNTLYVVNNYNDFLINDNSYYFYPYFLVAEDIYYPFINRIYICDGSGFVNTYVSIYKIKLDEEITVEDLHILTPAINNIYSSEKNIYLIRSYGRITLNHISDLTLVTLACNPQQVLPMRRQSPVRIHGALIKSFPN